MTFTLDSLRGCLEGAVPSVIATCAPDGTPNVAYLSQVHFVDNAHVALSFQFFSKTRENVLANPYARVQVIDPDTAGHYRLGLRYLRTETEGPLFESMKAKLAGIASHTGMSKVFRLLGADVYEVLEIEAVPGSTALPPRPQRNRLASLRRCTTRLSACVDMSALFDEVLECLGREFDIRHSMLLLLGEDREHLYTVGSRGYDRSGVGSEIRLGDGIIGVAARQCTPIRILHTAPEYLYGRAARESFKAGGMLEVLETEIPLPGLVESRSQLAVPILQEDRLLGVLYVESPENLRFSYEDEDALVMLSQQLSMAIRLSQLVGESRESERLAPEQTPLTGAPLVIRRYPANNSIFIDGSYLIKGVAGAIFWRLVTEYVVSRRTDFTNRELRLDPSIGLPELSENLEARLILLQRRLQENDVAVRIRKTGRGRFRLDVNRPLSLDELSDVP